MIKERLNCYLILKSNAKFSVTVGAYKSSIIINNFYSYINMSHSRYPLLETDRVWPIAYRIYFILRLFRLPIYVFTSIGIDCFIAT